MNDIAVFSSLLYICADFAQEWEQFRSCSKPIHAWFLVSCPLAMCFRLVRVAAAWLQRRDANSSAGAFGDLLLLDIRGKGPRCRTLVHITWAVVMPFFAILGVLGTSWVWDVMNRTPQCMPDQLHVWFACFWVTLCNFWSILHCALGFRFWRAARKVRRVEANVRAVEDTDSLQRWGSVDVSDTLVNARTGLDPEQIKALPCETMMGTAEAECPICLAQVCDGDCTRRLPMCGHTFHKSCIDLWLVRNAECPLCKQEVISKPGSVWI